MTSMTSASLLASPAALAPARQGIPILWASGLAMLAAGLVVERNSGAPMLVFNLGLALGVAAWAMGVLLENRKFQAQQLLSGLCGLTLLGWYVGRLVGQSHDEAVRIHFGNLAGNVLPGILLGLVAAASLLRRLGLSGEAEVRRWGRSFRRLLWANVAVVLGIAVWLLSRTGEGILLVSTDLLEGAELYQVLGDALIVNLVACQALELVDSACSPRARRPILPLMIMQAGSLAAAILLGSNKLLLVSLLLLLSFLVRVLVTLRARQPGSALLCALVVAGAFGMLIAEFGGLEGVLGLTRLLDYGNVDSIWDTPSVASRIDLILTCGAAQFARAPWIGDLAAELMTCGPGEYLHSLLSIQTHLGLVGSALALVVLARSLQVLGSRREYRALLWPLGLVVAVAGIGAFFTWLPLWFAAAWCLALPVPASGHPCGRAPQPLTQQPEGQPDSSPD